MLPVYLHCNLTLKRIDFEWNKVDKIREIIKEGISFSGALKNGIFKEDVNKTDRKAALNELFEKKLKIEERIKRATSDAKISHLIIYFENRERDGVITISVNGYEKLLLDLKQSVKGLDKLIRQEFELQESSLMKGIATL